MNSSALPARPAIPVRQAGQPLCTQHARFAGSTRAEQQQQMVEMNHSCRVSTPGYRPPQRARQKEHPSGPFARAARHRHGVRTIRKATEGKRGRRVCTRLFTKTNHRLRCRKYAAHAMRDHRSIRQNAKDGNRQRRMICDVYTLPVIWSPMISNMPRMRATVQTLLRAPFYRSMGSPLFQTTTALASPRSWVKG